MCSCVCVCFKLLYRLNCVYIKKIELLLFDPLNKYDYRSELENYLTIKNFTLL